MKNNLSILRAVFFLSGFAALIYQIAWQRLLFTAFGVDLESITIIIAVFMAGLGAGAYAGGRIADRSPQKIVFIFALVELGIGLFGLASPFLIGFIKHLFLYSNTLTIAIANFFLLLLPTFLMGSTLPLLTKHFNHYLDNIGNNIGWLYFTNTLGAATACLMTGFVLLSHFSLDQVIYIAAAINLIIASTVFLRYRHQVYQGIAVIPSTKITQQTLSAEAKKAIILSFLGGFLSLSLEVIYIRLFSFRLWGIPQSFSLVLALFLLGIAFGALVGKQICQSGKANISHIGLLFLIAALFDGIAISSIIYNPDLLVFIIVVFMVALWRGIVFPIVHHLGSEQQKTGAAISNVYFANVLGCTLAPIFIGFGLLDILSTQQTYFVVILITVAIAFFCCHQKTLKGCAVGAVLLTAFLLFMPEKMINSLSQKKTWTIDRIMENKHGIIQVYQDENNDYAVFGNNAYDGMLNIDFSHNHNMIERAYLLQMIAPEAKNVLVVGLSTGSWVSVLSAMPHLESITVVELNPAYTQLANSYKEMAKILKDSRIHIITDDGRRWLTKHPNEKFDFILMNTTFHWRNYSSNLLSQEFFELAKAHLTPNGFIYFNTTGSPDAFYTVHSVFPYTYQYMNMAVGALAPLSPSAIHKESVKSALAQMQWQDKTKVFESEDGIEKGTEALLENKLIPYSEIKFKVKRPLQIITDQNMITEYRYGLLSSDEK